MVKKKTSKKKTEPIADVGKTVENLNSIIFEDKLPDVFIDMYKLAMITSRLFDQTTLGGVFKNIAYQMTELLFKYEIPTETFQGEISVIYAEYCNLIEERQKILLEQAKTLMKNTNGEKQ